MQKLSFMWGRFGLLGSIAFAAFALAPFESADAGAWTREKDTYLFVLPFDYVTADKQFDDDGNKINRLRFQQVQISPYLEYGLTDDFTIGAQPKFRWVRQQTVNDEDAHNTGLSDISVFGRYRLWHQDAAALSFQLLGKIPVEADETEFPPLGYDQFDLEGSVLYGNAVQAGEGRVFYNIDVGYRKRFETPSDEIHGNAFLGWSPGGSRWTFVVASNNTFGVSNQEDNLIEALTARPDFRRNQAQVSASYRVAERVSIVAGGNTTFSGRNIGVSHGAFVSLVFNLDPSMIFGTEPYF